ncbi:hypothetical protein AVEN_80329-1 [Araneus ventricosus]|uniref:Transposase Tc1-like domain-containing protein n=1 Tax=Araneus ventricosus TaxID=182803 RepID=A0A4Y2NTK6_ARAVE|nr:hypothetical protein AVEN_80329-1 [Araneus ventricosus]
MSSIGCGTITKGIKTPLEDMGLDGRRSLPVAMCQTPKETNSVTAVVVALCCCRKAHICQTVSRRLHEGGLFARRPVVCLPLSPAHVRTRLHWTPELRSWTPENWDHALFTDEFRFNIHNDSRRAIIWREPGTRYRAPNVVERDHT